MDDNWFELGEDIAHDGRNLKDYLNDAESDSERRSILAGYLKQVRGAD